MSPIDVAIVGADGETGSSIVDGLLECGAFHVKALVRPESLLKQRTVDLEKKGGHVIPVDLTQNDSALLDALADVDTVIAAVSAFDYDVQYVLLETAKKAGVKRFVPSSFTDRRQIFDYIKTIGLPLTVIDAGWWYQASIPRGASEAFDYATQFNRSDVAGDGDTPSALTDQRDVGRFVARVIRDPRTINQFVLAHGEVWTPNQICRLLDELSGGEVHRVFISEEKLRDRVRQAAAVLGAHPDDKSALWAKVNGEIQMSVEIGGHNAPEKVASLGYLVAKDLYPDWTSRKFADLVEEMLRGQGRQLYASKERMQTFRDAV